MLLEFVYGAIIAMVFQAFGRRRRLGIALTVVGAIAAIAMRALHVITPPEQWILQDQFVLFRVFTWGIAAACVVGGVVLWLPDTNDQISRAVVVLGNASYSAYLASNLVIYSLMLAVKAYMRHTHSPFFLSVQIVFQTAIVSIAMLTGWIIYQRIEFPLLHTLQRRFSSKP